MNISFGGLWGDLIMVLKLDRGDGGKNRSSVVLYFTGFTDDGDDGFDEMR